MKTRNPLSLAASLLTLSAILSGCVLETVNETVEKQQLQDARTFHTLAVTDLQSTDIAITGWSSDSVHTTVRLDVWASDAERARRIADGIGFGWSGATEAELKLKYGGSDQELAKLSHVAMSAPARLGLRLETSSGDVTVSGMSGDLTIETSSGRINAKTAGRINFTSSSGDVVASTALGGSLDLSSGDATVDITSKDFDGLDATTSSGDVTVHLADSAHVTLDLSTSSGSIDVDYGGTRTSSADGDLRVQQWRRQGCARRDQ